MHCHSGLYDGAGGGEVRGRVTREEQEGFGTCEVVSHVPDVECRRLEGVVQGQQDGGLLAFRTEVRVSWGREVALCYTQAFSSAWNQGFLFLVFLTSAQGPGSWL